MRPARNTKNVPISKTLAIPISPWISSIIELDTILYTIKIKYIFFNKKDSGFDEADVISKETYEN
jgi:hypothetical protein